MLIVGKQDAYWQKGTINFDNNAIDFGTPRLFEFWLVDKKLAQDYSNPVARRRYTLTIRTIAKLPFNEDDRIVWNDKNYTIVEVIKADNPLMAMLSDTILVMVG